MFIAYTVVAVVLALANAGTATAKLRRAEPATSGLLATGVPESWFVPLALLNLAGAAGLLIGIGWRPLGIAAAAGLVLYFGGALGFHVRAKDFKGMPMPGAFFLLSVVALALGIASR
ncbi:DoxX family protein [Winogradskya humida]|uniref:Membrane protein n=1 Tax=Winogradskya humida TaxID=113566 RepID=A0ABQ3ZI63_9ACTN|nr:DoxX family protein [Actinoplanes humidus]GIE18266.1 membrane protein [Actinoplanes humidus]